jgi:hypothetical protein
MQAINGKAVKADLKIRPDLQNALLPSLDPIGPVSSAWTRLWFQENLI